MLLKVLVDYFFSVFQGQGEGGGLFFFERKDRKIKKKYINTIFYV